jgi:hypothetical protein
MNKRYPWDRLKNPGMSFLWKRADERSLRSQANKQGKRRKVVYSVRVESATKLRVTLEHGLLSGTRATLIVLDGLDTPPAHLQPNPDAPVRRKPIVLR